MATDVKSSFDGTLVLHGLPVGKMTDEEFYEFCQKNPDLRIEQTAEGDLIVMSPTGLDSGDRNAEITMQLRLWAKATKLGKAYDSNTGFVLPNGAKRAPDASWIPFEKLNQLTANERKQFGPLSPDFAIELRSESDTFRSLQKKLQEYIENGTRLGWLIDPFDKKVEIYRPGKPPELLESPATVSGDPELPGFVLELADVWNV